jgi:uroporphyrin-III C-methyltransferase
MKGKVWLVGAGPGAPDLITVRGAELLKRADIVFHDALVHPGMLAMAANARLVAVGKRCGVFHGAAVHQQTTGRCAALRVRGEGVTRCLRPRAEEMMRWSGRALRSKSCRA